MSSKDPIYICCYSNIKRPGVLTIMCTFARPIVCMLSQDGRWRARPYGYSEQFKLEFAKVVDQEMMLPINVNFVERRRKREKAWDITIGKMMRHFSHSIGNGKYYVSVDKVRDLFNIIMGPYWTPSAEQLEDDRKRKNANLRGRLNRALQRYAASADDNTTCRSASPPVDHQPLICQKRNRDPEHTIDESRPPPLFRN